MKLSHKLSTLALFALTICSGSLFAQTATTKKPTHPDWMYREWPEDPKFLKLVANVPNLHAMDPNMFRYVFGSMPVRINITDGEGRALVIGQDGTHGAEVAGEPFNGAGTGGRGQHMVYHMTGTDEGIYMNTFTYTIRKQYGDYAPVVVTNKLGERELVFRAVLPPNLYLLAQHTESEFVKYRNSLIEAILARNPKLEIVLGYGGAARDSIATYLEAKGVKLEAKNDSAQIADYSCVPAELNRMFCFPIDAQKNNLLLLANERKGPNSTSVTPIQLKLMKQRVEDREFLRDNVLPYVVAKPLVYPGQMSKALDSKGVAGIRGLFTITVNGQQRNIIAKAGPHPGTAGGGTEAQAVAATKKLETSYQSIFEQIMSARNYLRFDMNSPMLRNEAYRYSHRDIPNNKVFSSKKSSGASTDASRSGRQVINFGGREKAEHNFQALAAAKKAVTPAQVGALMAAGDIPWDGSRVNALNFHRPVKEWIKFIVEKISPVVANNAIWSVVSNVKDHGYFGVYRGNFKQPATIILTDSSVQDLDALITGMALSGPNGRRLQAYLKAQGLDKNYLILNILPFDMTQPATATQAQKDAKFNQALTIMKPWYSEVIKKLLAGASKTTPVKIITLGQYVAKAVDLTGVKAEVTNLSFASLPAVGIDIPMGDLFHGERTWMGKGNASSVVRSSNYPGKIYGWVAPDAVANAKVPRSRVETAYFNFVQKESQGGKRFPIVFSVTPESDKEVVSPDDLDVKPATMR